MLTAQDLCWQDTATCRVDVLVFGVSCSAGSRSPWVSGTVSV